MRVSAFIGVFLFFYPIVAQCQDKTDLPYKGGSVQFEKEVSSSLFVVSGDTAGIYFVEVYYSRRKKQVEFTIHGGDGNEGMKKLVESFFTGTKENWDIASVKKLCIIIPLVIIPRNDNSNGCTAFVNSIALSEHFSKSFRPHACFLYKPLFFFRHVLEVDME
ncbi:MAG: hypothetical protein ABL876_12520 [Chitinophagaceae bacterium]